MAIKIRDYEVRLTRSKEERKLVRQLRYRCFVEEEGFPATEEQKELGEEYDDFDTHADYMGVFYDGKIIGTYRIIDREASEKLGGFYSETEFDITKIKKRSGNICEMSRACIDREYRDNPLVMSMLWLGLGEYIQRNKIQVLFGMVTWFGGGPIDAAQALSYLYYNHLSPANLRASVDMNKMAPSVNPKLTRMNILPKVFVDKDKAFREMPTLLKGYLRLNGTFGKGVSICPREDNYSVFVMVLTKNINKAYQKRFTGNPNAFDNLGLRDGAIATFGKILALPFKGAFLTLKALAGLFLNDDDLTDAEIARDEARDDDI
ncbi:MAG: GNAT family N-acetyltransferase [Rickettsiales bacterium]|jgi:putative hemolysin|nr:GNAT family N-acetyltransferase [Rickettsiales bacterium]